MWRTSRASRRRWCARRGATSRSWRSSCGPNRRSPTFSLPRPRPPGRRRTRCGKRSRRCAPTSSRRATPSRRSTASSSSPMSDRVALALALLLSACAGAPTHPDAFVFGVLGDTPYTEREEHEFAGMIERMNREPLAFSIHVGDIKGAGPCSDELFLRRREEFNRFRQPLVYTPGDNEWTDCRRRHMGSGDPLDALARLRKVFFSEPYSLGATRLETAVQASCAAPPPAGCG